MSPAVHHAIETHGLGRRFGDLAAVDDLDLRVPAGTFFGFLGPNGAGKSTTLKMLTGLLAPSSGEARVLGLDVVSEAVEVKRRIGVVPEDLALFDHLSGPEYLRFCGRMHGLADDLTTHRSRELLDLMGLTEAGRKWTGDYSHGMKKKLSLAAALLHGPRLLFLDEPFEGIDAVSSRRIKNLLQRLVASGVTVFLTSHILEIVERTCSHLAILDRGRLRAQGTLDDLRRGAEGQPETSLEEVFLALIGDRGQQSATLSWLTPDPAP